MRLFHYVGPKGTGTGIVHDGQLRGLVHADPACPGTIDTLLEQGDEAVRLACEILAAAPQLESGDIQYLPPVFRPGKILCIGLNYADHGDEVGMASVDYPTVFARFTNGLVGHDASLVRPRLSEQFDYEGELALVIGKRARHVEKRHAFDYIAGYSIFNDGSVRDYQTRTSQWTMGKNFDQTASFGPWLVTSDELPAGAHGLRIQTRVNGAVVQDSTTDRFIFDVATLIATLSEVMTLEPGDVIATGTPSGVGAARKPPLFLRPGDRCDIEIEGLGILSNPIIDESVPASGDRGAVSPALSA